MSQPISRKDSRPVFTYLYNMETVVSRLTFDDNRLDPQSAQLLTGRAADILLTTSDPVVSDEEPAAADVSDRDWIPSGSDMTIRTALLEARHVWGEEPLTDEDVISLLKDTFDAREVEET